MKRTTALFALIFFVLGVYYPVVFAEINSLDDLRMLDDLPTAETFNLVSLFNPLHSIGYYRPLTIFSYYIDTVMLGFCPQAMHLENVLIHLVNTLLLFYSALLLFRLREKRVELAFLSAAVFALHPLNVESVAWISGRTDPLAALFVLAGLSCIALFMKSEKTAYLWLASLCCLLGSLAKETALFALPAFFLLVCMNDMLLSTVSKLSVKTAVVRRFLLLVVPFLTIGLLYVALRIKTVLFMSQLISPPTVQKAAVGASLSPFTVIYSFFTTVGFYVKKFIFPLPLNFAITHVSSIYGVVGIGVVLLTCYLSVKWRRNIAVQMLGASLIVMVSAFLISRAQIAWTPYAERYMYLPSLFLAIGVVDFFSLGSRIVSPRIATFLFFTLLSCMAGISTNRALIWQNNLTLYQDTHKKSPDFASINNELAVALIDNNQLSEATQQIELGKKAPNGGNMPLLCVNQALMLASDRKFLEAYTVLESSYAPGSIDTAHIEVVKAYLKLMELESVYCKDPRRLLKIYSKLATLHEFYYKKSGDTDHLYRAAQLAFIAHDNKHAHVLFETVAEKAPTTSMFKNFAKKMALKTAPAATSKGHSVPQE